MLCSVVFAVPLNAQNNSSPPIVIGLTLNESVRPVVYSGWPLLVGVTLMNEHAYQASVPVILALNWKTFIHLIVNDTAGNQFTWPFHLVAVPDENVTLDSLTFAQVGYWLEPNEISQIPEGDYELTVFLDSSAYSSLGNSFLSVESAPRNITISSAPGYSSVEQKTEKDLLLTNLNILKRDNIKAMEYLNGILMYNPNNLTALTLIGKLLENEGDAGGALYVYSKAVEIFYENNPDPAEPPFELLHAWNALFGKLNSADSFVVTYAAKDTAHPAYGLGSSFCYYVDNIPFRELQLTRGKTYTFHMKDIPSTDPLYFSADARGGGSAPYTDGVNGTPADGNNIISFVVGNSAPDILYYQSTINEFVGWRITVSDIDSVTSVSEINLNNLNKYSLSLAYPNPFNPSTIIKYQIPTAGIVSLKVYDILGKEVATLVDEYKPAGSYEVKFNAEGFVSGVYFYRIHMDSFTQTKKMILMR
jgi:hypothetical protein